MCHTANVCNKKFVQWPLFYLNKKCSFPIFIADGHRVLIHCYGGLGRAVLVAACLLQVIDEDLTPDDAISQMRELRGPRAVQSVKQYNFISEFRDLCIKAENFDYEDEGCVSRWKSLIFLLPFTVEFHEKVVKVVMIWVTQKLRRQVEQGFSSFFANFFDIYLLTFYCEVVHWR